MKNNYVFIYKVISNIFPVAGTIISPAILLHILHIPVLTNVPGTRGNVPYQWGLTGE